MYSVKFSFFLKKKPTKHHCCSGMDRKYANYATSHHRLIDLEVILKLICYLAYLSDHDVTDFFFF